jgi:hypothetical protein
LEYITIWHGIFKINLINRNMLKLPLYYDIYIYIMEMSTCMILNKAQLPALKSFLYFLFQIWQIMSWYSFVCVKIIFFRFKKSEKIAPQKKDLKKKKSKCVHHQVIHDDTWWYASWALWVVHWKRVFAVGGRRFPWSVSTLIYIYIYISKN